MEGTALAVAILAAHILAMTDEAITRLLREAGTGRREALDQLFPLVYEELRRRAHRYLDGERTEHTLSTTALVHEAYLELIDIERVEYRDRNHFLAMAARAMRRILVDSARRHGADKRGGGNRAVNLDDTAVVSAQRSEQILALDSALERLGRNRERLALTVELRFFGGLSIAETAGVLGVATSTVELDWKKAKAWLYRELND